MQRIIFESAPEFIIVCLLVGIAYASILYINTKRPWNKTINIVLFVSRAILVSFLSILLLGPIVKQITNYFERPLYLIVLDNSASVAQVVDSVGQQQLMAQIHTMQEALADKGYEVLIQDLEGNPVDNSPGDVASASNLNGVLNAIAGRYEGRNIAGVIMATDGIYNSGLSPLYAMYNFPVHTIGIGDTLDRLDIAIKNVAYNRIAYQGNKFPIRAEVQIKNLPSQTITATLSTRGRMIDRQTKTVSGDELVAFDFHPDASEQGIQKYDITLNTHPDERNTQNNQTSVFIDVVEGKKKILLIASAPHPDIKALREVIDQNPNYEFTLYIPGVKEQPAAVLQPQNVDLVIFHQGPDLKGKTRRLFQTFSQSRVSMLFILGQQTDLPYMAQENMPITFENAPQDYDEVTPIINQAFSNFSLSPEVHTAVAGYPPVTVHYGKVRIPNSATALLYQKIGSIVTDKPLLTVDIRDDRKIGIMLGEGMWRWRLNEFDRTESSDSFDELFGKLIQFLSTTEDKRKFRSYPIEQEFSETEPVVFESQVYNDIFEPVFGNTISIEITDETGRKSDYTYVTSPGNIRYQIGGLNEGVYRYRSSTLINGTTEQVRGEFAVIERDTELQNLTADFDMLRKLAANTGGRFVNAANMEGLRDYLRQTESRTIIHSEETYDAIINIKWVFWLLVALVAVEWTLRKYHGSY